jgi:hypothetical protein
MRRTIMFFAGAIIAASALSAEQSFPTTWVLENTVSITPGDSVEIYSVPELSSVNFDNVLWDGGYLKLRNCLIDTGQFSRSDFDLPIYVGAGQSLDLSQTIIQNADTAIFVDGGTLTISSATLDAWQTGIVIDNSTSEVFIDSCNFCRSEIGLQLKTTADVHINNSLFISNITAIECVAGENFSIENTLFQSNEVSLQIPVFGTVPQIGQAVDFIGGRYYLVKNLSLSTLDLGSNYVDDPGKNIGTTGGGITPQHIPKVPAAPLCAPIDADNIIDDELILSWTPALQTINGIPCTPTQFIVCTSNSAYGNFQNEFYSSDTSATIDENGSFRFYRVTSSLGVWIDE